MASVIASHAQRCVIWFGAPGAREQALVAAGGWHLRIVQADGTHQVGMRGGDAVVAVFDLRGADAVRLAALQRAHAEHADLPTLALADAADAGDPVRQRLQAACTRCLHAPFEPARLDAAFAALLDSPGRDVERIGGQSPAMLGVRAVLHRYADVDLPVLITGESGTGKELAAHALHELSRRRGRPFVAMNCGAISPTLVQSELFGHERGAFTGATTRRMGLFESAEGGTVFLDEIGDLPLDAQTNLLRVLQEGTVERVGSNRPVRWTCACWPRPMWTWTRRSRPGGSARISTTGSTSCVCSCRHCVPAARTSNCWHGSSSTISAAATPCRHAVSVPPHGSACASTPGPATCVNCSTVCAAPRWSRSTR